MFLLLFLLASFGITAIITNSSIFSPIRNLFEKINPSFLGEGIVCPQCVGFWIGVILSVIGFNISYQYVDLQSLFYKFWVSVLINASISSGFSYFIYYIFGFLDVIDEKNLRLGEYYEMRTILLSEINIDKLKEKIVSEISSEFVPDFNIDEEE